MEVPWAKLGHPANLSQVGEQVWYEQMDMGGGGRGELLFPPETLIAFPFVVCLIAHECLFSCKMRRDVSQAENFRSRFS